MATSSDEQRVTDEQLTGVEAFARASGNLLALGMLAELRAARAELARYKTAVAKAHQIMDGAIVRGGYRLGEEEQVATLLSLPL